MSQKKHPPHSQTQAVEKPPIELADDQLDTVQGGAITEVHAVDSWDVDDTILNPPSTGGLGVSHTLGTMSFDAIAKTNAGDGSS